MYTVVIHHGDVHRGDLYRGDSPRSTHSLLNNKSTLATVRFTLLCNDSNDFSHVGHAPAPPSPSAPVRAVPPVAALLHAGFACACLPCRRLALYFGCSECVCIEVAGEGAWHRASRY
jgi:hypothetical protein